MKKLLSFLQIGVLSTSILPLVGCGTNLDKTASNKFVDYVQELLKETYDSEQDFRKILVDKIKDFEKKYNLVVYTDKTSKPKNKNDIFFDMYVESAYHSLNQKELEIRVTGTIKYNGDSSYTWSQTSQKKKFKLNTNLLNWKIDSDLSNKDNNFDSQKRSSINFKSEQKENNSPVVKFLKGNEVINSNKNNKYGSSANGFSYNFKWEAQRDDGFEPIRQIKFDFIGSKFENLVDNLLIFYIEDGDYRWIKINLL
ncbi:hypothetical protein [Spiroplasma tabanidicola]|uniref:Uncharacterized protein n=1 Tax=Spiroplasma tabanidicola TaxID=324079 RepID=A0A6I6CK36_9MOLU|nr:hypothetical protein [Spiroplasma tabanidicola]QGS52463.1 hypothetical protein STABA_v1c11160 [Spiroplasma tabanidicola]